jgi:hypothetical protein
MHTNELPGKIQTGLVFVMLCLSDYSTGMEIYSDNDEGCLSLIIHGINQCIR